jgi:transposase InsO family protein
MIFCILCAAVHTWFQLLRGSSRRKLVAEVIALRAQLIVQRRKSPRSPRLSPVNRLILAIACAFVPKRILSRTFIIVKPATVLKFHRWLVEKKYSKLYRNHKPRTGRPPLSKTVRTLILEIKEKNPSFGCPQIASLIFDRTGISVSEETVRRTLMRFYTGSPGRGPSWLSFLSTQANSLWSLDLFQVDSVFLSTHWVLVVMDQWSRQIVGFAVSHRPVTAMSLTQMFTSMRPEAEHHGFTRG